jgi:hypothetical protein
VTKTQPKDMGASVRARLARLSRERGEDFQLVLTRYANRNPRRKALASRAPPPGVSRTQNGEA